MEALKIRINERRNKDIISLFVLQNGYYPNQQTNNYFTYCSKNLVKSLAKKTVERLLYEVENPDENIEEESDSEHEVSALDELQKTINSVMAFPQVDRQTALDKELKHIEVNRS